MSTFKGIFEENHSSTEVVYHPCGEVKVKTPEYNVSSFVKTWVEFTEATTLHGIRHIWTEGSFKLRRFVWLLLVLAGISLMSYQIIDRIIFYYSWPANVNVRVNFNSTLTFPAITICNQNAFKATSAAADNRYRLIETIHSQTEELSSLDLDRVFNASHIPLDDLLLRAAHKKDDLIISCSWGNAPCYLDNFTKIVTDHGVCFTFNNPPNHSKKLMVNNAGIDYGLQLVLNVEQFEYMPGPHGAAGVKIYIHDQDEFPLVGKLGLAIPTGSHTFVGNSLFVLKNLPPPHGECGRKDMTYFSSNLTYSTALCKIDCLTIEMDKACGCRDSHMPHINGVPRVCTLGENYDCMLPFLKYFHINEKDMCECPVPCRFQAYEPSISYATTSSFVIDRLLASLNSEELQRKYITAREVTHRLEADKFFGFKATADAVTEKLSVIESLLKEKIGLKLDEQLEMLQNKKAETYRSWKRKNFLNEYQKYVVQKNFLRARDAMEERTLSQIGDGYQEFNLNVGHQLRALSNFSAQHEAVRYTMYVLLKNSLAVEIEMIKRGFDNFTELIDSYKNGTQIFTYRFGGLPRDNNQYIVPKKLLNSSLVRNYAARKYGALLFPDLKDMVKDLETYQNLTEVAYYQRTVNEDALLNVSDSYARFCRRHFADKHNVYYESLEWPVKFISTKMKRFTELWEEFTRIAQRIKGNIEVINESLSEVQEKVMPKLRKVSQLSQAYIVNPSITKLDVAKVALSPNVHEGINTMKVFFLEVRSRGQAIFDDWSQLSDVTVRIWQEILNDQDCIEYYEWKEYDEFLQNETSVVDKETGDFLLIRDDTDIRDLIGNKDRAFYSSLYKMMSVTGNFKKSTKLDSGFLKDNFVFLDVFYSQLSYEEVQQQEDYTIFSLLCDIGGSMGLFLGASAMSLFELVDLFVDQSVKQVVGRH